MKKKLQRLVAVTEVSYAAQQMKLSQILRAEQELLRDLAEVDRRLNEQHFDPAANPADAKAEINWQAWCEKERRRINLRLARVRAERLAMKDEVARHFGRFLAAQSLSDRQVKDQKS